MWNPAAAGGDCLGGFAAARAVAGPTPCAPPGSKQLSANGTLAFQGAADAAMCAAVACRGTPAFGQTASKRTLPLGQM